MRLYDLLDLDLDTVIPYPYVVDMGDDYVMPDGVEEWANKNTKGVIFGGHFYFKTLEDRTLFIMRWAE